MYRTRSRVLAAFPVAIGTLVGLVEMPEAGAGTGAAVARPPAVGARSIAGVRSTQPATLLPSRAVPKLPAPIGLRVGATRLPMAEPGASLRQAVLQLSQSTTPRTHRVRTGENLTVIAARYGVTTTQLQAANSIANPNLIYTGQVLTIPGTTVPVVQAPSPTAAPATAPAPRPVSAQAAQPVHTVRSGETLSSIASRYGVPISELVSENAMSNPNLVRVGTRVVIPVPTLPPALFKGDAYDPVRLAMVPSFHRWADANGLPRDLLKAVAYMESRWNSGAVSSVGAMGVGQLMPGTATFIAQVLIGQPQLDPTVADDNIRMSARYLRYLLELTGGDENLALASYYQGYTSVTERGQYDDTVAYVRYIQGIRHHFR